MIIDLKYWRDNDMFQKFLQIIEEHAGRMRQHDQEILNIAFHDKVKDLPFRYNTQEYFLLKPECISYLYGKYKDEIEDSVANYCVLHYTGVKPWKGECSQPLKCEFFKYQAMTQWKGTKIVWNTARLRRNLTIYRWMVKLGLRKTNYRNLPD